MQSSCSASRSMNAYGGGAQHLGSFKRAFRQHRLHRSRSQVVWLGRVSVYSLYEQAQQKRAGLQSDNKRIQSRPTYQSGPYRTGTSAAKAHIQLSHIQSSSTANSQVKTFATAFAPRSSADRGGLRMRRRCNITLAFELASVRRCAASLVSTNGDCGYTMLDGVR